MRQWTTNRIPFLFVGMLGILLCFSGCGESQVETAAEIELLEPVGGILTTETVTYRNLYDAEVYPSAVLPYIEEYAFAEGGEVERIEAFPGEQVKAGETLVYRSTEKLDEDIEALEEQIADMEEEYAEYCQDMTKELAEPKGEVERLAEIVEDYEEDEPEQYIIGADGSEQENPAYTKWLKEYKEFEEKYTKQGHNVALKEAALRQRTENYELDHAYYVEKLKAMKGERAEYVLCSEMDGEVVAIGQMEYDTYHAEAEEAVIAVGDESRKMVQCSYIKPADVTGAEAVYAVVDGQKYALTYEPMDSHEYRERTERGETVYATFAIADTAAELQVGDYAVVAVVKEMRENVLSVPKAALYKEGATRFVYVVMDGQSVRRDVTVGMSDGLYTEILSGLEEGEQVMVTEAAAFNREEIATVERGTYNNVFSQKGYMYYPSIVDVRNPVTYGTTYHVDTHVELYQYVEKGDVIATIRVESDGIELQRKQLKLQRQQERLQDILAEGDPEGNAREIADKQEAIAELQEQIGEMEQDMYATQIVAPKSGIVVKVDYFGEDEILKEDCLIAQIADENNCYIKVDNSSAQLDYGSEVTITYMNAYLQEATATGRVANVTQMGVSAKLQSEKALIQVSPEVCSELIAINTFADSKGVKVHYQITANTQEMADVLLVPKEAVKEVAGCTYVYVVDGNGEVMAQSFLAGGHDNSCYWVIEGLTEGTKVCLK